MNENTISPDQTAPNFREQTDLGSYCLQLTFTYKCHLLITFANSLDPDQTQLIIGPDLDPNCFDNLIVFLNIFLLKLINRMIEQVSKKTCKIIITQWATQVGYSDIFIHT